MGATEKNVARCPLHGSVLATGLNGEKMCPEGHFVDDDGTGVAMGTGGPCMSCGGNDGYGLPPHHTPDCYFASWEDAGHPSSEGLSPSADAPGTGGSPNPERLSSTEKWTPDRCDGGYACCATEHVEGCFTGEGDPEAVKGAFIALLREAEAREEELRAENKRLRELYENAVINRGRFGWTINHLLECEEALNMVEGEAGRLRDALERIATMPKQSLGVVDTEFSMRIVANNALVDGPSAKGSSPESRPGLDV